MAMFGKKKKSTSFLKINNSYINIESVCFINVEKDSIVVGFVNRSIVIPFSSIEERDGYLEFFNKNLL